MTTKILLLSASPKNEDTLRVDEEFREIKESLRQGKYRDNFETQQGGAIRTKDLMQSLLDYEPNILHFSGHASEAGIYIEDESGNSHHGSIISNPFFIADRQGNQNSALSFDGIDDWIEVNSSSLFPSDAITICYWLNRNGNNITFFQNYISKELSFSSYIQDSPTVINRLGSGYWLGSPGVW